jgi:hypothetical protein
MGLIDGSASFGAPCRQSTDWNDRKGEAMEDRMITDRATAEEKAAAWDQLMKSSEREALALEDAFSTLRKRVIERENAELGVRWPRTDIEGAA